MIHNSVIFAVLGYNTEQIGG